MEKFNELFAELATSYKKEIEILREQNEILLSFAEYEREQERTKENK